MRPFYTPPPADIVQRARAIGEALELRWEQAGRPAHATELALWELFIALDTSQGGCNPNKVLDCLVECHEHLAEWIEAAGAGPTAKENVALAGAYTLVQAISIERQIAAMRFCLAHHPGELEGQPPTLCFYPSGTPVDFPYELRPDVMEKVNELLSLVGTPEQRLLIESMVEQEASQAPTP